ncbi:hypothetical protein FGO68_gene15600 [Halteria grandinella]|uniref:Uncharacterized protein n=1 Tax=Halteria grandinella TaxID=5974 RepID=A0A8J8P8S9_HALGN|nr:hypothetical protein FGO68_gene15600 [Halteria grandinella]
MNVTEGLFFEMGLHSQLFRYLDASFSTMINIEKICRGIKDEETEYSLMREGGMMMKFDTREIIESVDIEKLDQREIDELRVNLSCRQGFVQMIKQDLRYDKQVLCIYRVILIGANRVIADNHSIEVDEQNSSDLLKGLSDLSSKEQLMLKKQHQASVSSAASGFESMASVSSTSSDNPM